MDGSVRQAVHPPKVEQAVDENSPAPPSDSHLGAPGNRLDGTYSAALRSG